ncbi:MAG TPA: bestrophin family ion channel [Pirellulales bacterium]
MPTNYESYLLPAEHFTANMRRLWVVAAGLMAYSSAWVLCDKYISPPNVHANLHFYLGLVLGTLLVFRTNTAYDRWWEGRKLWGKLVNDSRNLAVKVEALVSDSRETKQQVGAMIVAFAEGLKEHLRDGVKLQDLPAFADDPARPEHVPSYITRRVYEQINDWRRKGKLAPFQQLMLDTHAAQFLEIAGACERIRKTPIAPSYRSFIRQSIAVYVLSLPFGLADDLGWLTVPIVVVVGYSMIGVELIAEDIEEPFGAGDDDIQTDRIAQVIRNTVTEILAPRPGDDERDASSSAEADAEAYLARRFSEDGRTTEDRSEDETAANRGRV